MKYLFKITKSTLLGISFCLLSINMISSQTSWELNLGVNTSNVMHTIEGQQITYPFILNAPLWNYGFQVGINKEIFISNRLYLTAGYKVQLRGDKYSLHEVFPEDKIHSMRFYYSMIPVILHYRLLPSREIYFIGGISGDFLMFQNKINHVNYFEGINNFKERLGATWNIGFRFKLFSKIHCETTYSQSITDIVQKTTIDIPINRGFKHQAFELSLLYKL